MGNTSAKKGSGGSSAAYGERPERQGSAALGPFSFDEFSLLEELFLSLADAGGKHIDPAKFRKHFALEGADWFPERLLAVFLDGEQELTGSGERKLTLEGFREGVAATGRSSRAGMVQALYDICNPTGAVSLNPAELARLFEAAYCCGVAASQPPSRDPSPAATNGTPGTPEGTSSSDASGEPPGEGGSPSPPPSTQGLFRSDKLAESVKNHLTSAGTGGDAAGVSSQGLKVWVAERAPLLHHCLSTFMHTRCFLYGEERGLGVEALPSCAASLPSSLAVFTPPRPQEPSFLLDSHQAEVFGLALSTKALQGPWMRIYNSEEDGLSFNRVAFKLVGYGGPTVILIRERKSGAVWGGCADSPWKESNSFYGGEASFLLRLSPDFKVIPSKMASNNHFQYLNLKGFSLPHGFGMGGSTEAFRFFIPEALDDTCVGRSACLTFEQGELCPNQSRNFEVDIMEVWGVGGEEALGEALEAREKQRQYTAAQIHKARQVDKSKFATNAFDKEFLLGKTFGGGGGNYNANEDRRQGQR
ncbi:unnamed protein product [Scytosiphon promiscuus]